LAEEKKSAVRSVLLHTVFQLLSVAALLWLRTLTERGVLDGALLVLAVIDAALIPFGFVALYQRVREIEKGELDEAKKY